MKRLILYTIVLMNTPNDLVISNLEDGFTYHEEEDVLVFEYETKYKAIEVVEPEDDQAEKAAQELNDTINDLLNNYKY